MRVLVSRLMDSSSNAKLSRTGSRTTHHVFANGRVSLTQIYKLSIAYF